MKTLQILALSAMILPSIVIAEEIVLPPSQDEIDAFNACLRGKAAETCVLPTRTIIIPSEPRPDTPSSTPTRQFYQAPPDELVTGSANQDMRNAIRDADGYRTYQWGPIRTQDGPPEPFGSYAQDRGAGVDRDRGDAVGGGGDSNPGGGGTSGGSSSNGSGSGNSGSGGSGGSGSSGPGQTGGPDCRP